ncbi:hypothetical protein [Clostridium sp. LIBA-8841]|uniref:hypothetical protein n=1 Tax=Clostridium sp. LIBA-8841 TaxID=2987530 RepID=UPI002AC58C5D|nr:hypothetical protein [Clostridium sp. LIBA-8841]MDZ5253727.1 hypothetical protein [Clostridium sp. LIBA-8841]
MNFIDTYDEILACFSSNEFNIELWETYSNIISRELANKVKIDIKDYNYTKDILPVIEKTLTSRGKLKQVHESFIAVSGNIRYKFNEIFQEDFDVDIILYLGLCSGAGWATSLDNRNVILLGIEKIIELDWCDEDSMFALIAHEIGHVWHRTKGGCFGKQNNISEKALFQLYSEGVAMLFEQLLCRDENYYHQNQNGWIEWCEKNLVELKREYLIRITNSESVKDFFGDWNSYKGYSDVGYFLGCKFVRFLLEKYSLTEMLSMEMDLMLKEYIDFSK